MRYSRKPRDDSRKNRQARMAAQPPVGAVVKVFGPMHTNVLGKSTELWVSINETSGSIVFCDADGEDLTSHIMHMDEAYSADVGHGGAFLTALLLQLPAAEAAAVRTVSARAKRVLEDRMAGRMAIMRLVRSAR